MGKLLLLEIGAAHILNSGMPTLSLNHKEQSVNRSIAAALSFAAFVSLSGGTALAGPDDAKWVAQCVQDNKDEKATVEVISKYCTCMNNKMSENETQSITQWEKTHATERQACDKEAGWK
jgi:hypothetical protein